MFVEQIMFVFSWGIFIVVYLTSLKYSINSIFRRYLNRYYSMIFSQHYYKLSLNMGGGFVICDTKTKGIGHRSMKNGKPIFRWHHLWMIPEPKLYFTIKTWARTEKNYCNKIKIFQSTDFSSKVVKNCLFNKV